MPFDLVIDTPEWAVPLHATHTSFGVLVRYLGAYGGRSSGKSHEFATKVVEEMVADPDCSVVCIREIQKSLEKSARKLIIQKIKSLKVEHLFEILKTEIRRVGGEGVCIFQGMQDHTSDSIKSLEGFKIAWVEEAQSLSERSLRLLRPTIRMEGSQIWFTWNPRKRSDPVDKFLRGKVREDAIVVSVNFDQNIYCPEVIKQEAASDLQLDPVMYEHTWLGGYENAATTAVIPYLWIESAIGLTEDLGIDVSGARVSGLDVAGNGDGGDCNSQAFRCGAELVDMALWNGEDTSATTGRAVTGALVRGCRNIQYDSVGVGEGVTGEWAGMGRRGVRPAGMVLVPWSGGDTVLDPDDRINPDDEYSPTNREQYENLKAQGWFSLRRRFENAHRARKGMKYDPDHIISIRRTLPELDKLKEELSQPIFKSSSKGKTMVDKQPEGAPSPNRADSVMQAFHPLPTETGSEAMMVLSKRVRA